MKAGASKPKVDKRKDKAATATIVHKSGASGRFTKAGYPVKPGQRPLGIGAGVLIVKKDAFNDDFNN
ncbi:hypothetical protein GCM10027578_22090 [Spirosoma luteolum]